MHHFINRSKVIQTWDDYLQYLYLPFCTQGLNPLVTIHSPENCLPLWCELIKPAQLISAICLPQHCWRCHRTGEDGLAHLTCCTSTHSCILLCFTSPSLTWHPAEGTIHLGTTVKTQMPPFCHISFEPWFILISRNSICFAVSALSFCVPCFNEFHSTDTKGTSITLLNLFLLGAFKICFSKSLRRCIKSPAPNGKQCPFLGWPWQCNQWRHLRTGRATLENEIAMKIIPPCLFAR